jgi:hypothetical protein
MPLNSSENPGVSTLKKEPFKQRMHLKITLSCWELKTCHTGGHINYVSFDSSAAIFARFLRDLKVNCKAEKINRVLENVLLKTNKISISLNRQILRPSLKWSAIPLIRVFEMP